MFSYSYFGISRKADINGIDTWHWSFLFYFSAVCVRWLVMVCVCVFVSVCGWYVLFDYANVLYSRISACHETNRRTGFQPHIHRRYLVPPWSSLFSTVFTVCWRISDWNVNFSLCQIPGKPHLTPCDSHNCKKKEKKTGL